ncbi:MAG: hypothetical protein SFV21_05085 [Rhodospirillaceae bacterium]|nr:hypothetical protein [Rhodospirillaceae bacterium]
MVSGWRAIACVVVAGAAAPAGAADPLVLQQGFCINRDEQRCVEVALPGTTVDFSRLPRLPDGTRYIHFYSDQQADAGTLFVHVLDAEDEDPAVDVIFPEKFSDKGDKVRSSMAGLAEKVGATGGALVAPFEATGPAETRERFFTVLQVGGPGYFSGQVVDRNGELIPNSQRITFSVLRRAP